MTAAHPARFGDDILTKIDEIVPSGVRLLDPFAGTGLIHDLTDRETWGVEIEPEWATMHPRTIVGNALQLPFADESFEWVVTSPCYGNRMADHHDAQERCRSCAGSGLRPGGVGHRERCDGKHDDGDLCNERGCPKCDGLGRRSYTRLTYRHRLGRELHRDNSGQLQWGPAYRAFHEAAWSEVWRVLDGGGSFVLNVKDHERKKVVQPVVAFHDAVLREIGFEAVEWHEVPTKGMKFGANRDARVPFEVVAVYVKST